MTHRQLAHLLRQVVLERADDRTHGATAAAELRHAHRAVTGAAGALLLVHLLAGAGDVGAAERLGRTGATLGELILHHARDQIGARLEAEHVVRQFDLAGLLAV